MFLKLLFLLLPKTQWSNTGANIPVMEEVKRSARDATWEDCVWKVVAPVAGTRLDPCGAQCALSFQPPKLGLGPTTWQQQRGPTHLCCTSEGEKGVRHLKVRKVQSVQPPLQPGDPWRAHEFARWLVLAVSGSERQLGPLREGHRDVLPFNHMSHHSHVVFGWLEHRTRRVWCTEAGRNPSQKWWQDDLGLVSEHMAEDHCALSKTRENKVGILLHTPKHV